MQSIRVVRYGVMLALLSIAFGFAMGALFGANEAAMKGHLEAEGKAALAEKYGGDPAKMKAVVEKSWIYFQRAHLHGGALGAAALALCLLLAALPAGANRAKALAAACAGVGALGYGVYWLLAGLEAPGLGGTTPAKASLEWLAFPSAGLAIVGLLLTTLLAARALFRPPPTA